jgi:hypothetical protein
MNIFDNLRIFKFVRYIRIDNKTIEEMFHKTIIFYPIKHFAKIDCVLSLTYM